MAKADRLSVRQEAFAINVASGQPITEAYRNAGFTATGNAACVGATKLMKLAKVQAKTRSLQGKFEDARVRAASASQVVTAHTVTSMLEEIVRNATKDKQHGAAATAVMGLAKLHGLLVDKTEDVTRRAARSPDAPVEIEVEHWLIEQGIDLSGPAQGSTAQGSDRALAHAPAVHGAPLPEPSSPAEVQGSESPDDPAVPVLSHEDASKLSH